MDHFNEFESKLRQAGLGDSIVRAFRHSYTSLLGNQSGLLPESEIQAVTDLPRLEAVPRADAGASERLAQTAIVKLNGGLGTSMGLEGPKSLLTVKNGLSFLDIIARQVIEARRRNGTSLRFLLMNSFSTSKATLEWLQGYPDLGSQGEIELMQNRIPKVDASSLRPAQWPANPELEWCPPGHGDLYPSLLGSGWLQRLLDEGVRYLFVSNADNLGATLHPQLLEHFAASDQSLLMEVCERTSADRKGGHLARRDGRLLLRESAQCPPADQAAFQDIARHRFFNTNNLWIRLDRLRDLLEQHGGMIPLPVIRNAKTVDPRDPASPGVIQLETAMGAAIECFKDAGAIVVPRSRFAPVKTTADLLAVRSDAYDLTDDFRVELHASRAGRPPSVELDKAHYQQVDQLEQRLAGGVPSLRECDALKVEGPVDFVRGNVLRGRVTLRNPAGAPVALPAGLYDNTSLTL